MGGRGYPPQSQSDEQAAQVGKTKRFLNWIIENPVTVKRGITIAEVRQTMAETGVTGLPVLDGDKLVGLVTKRDLKFHTQPDTLVEDIMTTKLILETGAPSEESARAKFGQHRIEKLPVVDSQGRLTGLITVRDMDRKWEYPNAALDASGRLIVGAALGPDDWETRMPQTEKRQG